MNTEMTMSELRKYIRDGVHFFGKELYNVSKATDGFKIHVLDHDEYTIEIPGERSRAGGDLTTTCTIHLDENNRVGLIEHSYHPITKANKDVIIHFANLIDTKIIKIKEITEIELEG